MSAMELFIAFGSLLAMLLPLAGADGTPGRAGLLVRWAGTVRRRPGMLAAPAIAVVLVLSIPVLSLRLGAGDRGNTIPAAEHYVSGTTATFADFRVAEPDAETPAESSAIGGAARDLRSEYRSIVEALDDLGEPDGYFALGFARMHELAAELRRLREHASRPLVDLITAVERTSGLDMEAVAAAKLPWFLVIIGLSFLLVVVVLAACWALAGHGWAD